jgi:hypothetical protein
LPTVDRAFPAELVAIDCNDKVDLAVLLLKVPDDSSHGLEPILLNAQCVPGQLAFCGGFALGENAQVTEGIVTHSTDPYRHIVTNLTDSGTSGGPCFAAGYRRILGVIKRDFSSTHHRASIIPSITVGLFLDAQVGKVPIIEIEEK